MIEKPRRIKGEATFIPEAVRNGSETIRMTVRVRTKKGDYVDVVMTFPIHYWQCAHRKVSAVWYEERKIQKQRMDDMDKILGSGEF